MGMDLVEMSLRIEDCFKVRLSIEELTAVASKRKPPDFTAGELLEILSHNPAGLKCGYNLRGSSDCGHCPECGNEYEQREPDWEVLREIIAQTIGVDRQKVTRASMLIRDLGMK